MTTLFEHKNYVKPFHITVEDPYYSISCAFIESFGYDANHEQILMILSKFIFETGNFKECYNYNFGNWRCNPETSSFTLYKCSEIIKGKEVHYVPPQPETIFKSFNRAEEAFVFATNFLKMNRYKEALAGLVNSNPRQMIIGMHLGGYFTAPLETYWYRYKKVLDEQTKKYK